MSALADQILHNLKLQLDLDLYDKLGGEVQSGPFTGVLLSKEVNWNGSRLAPMLLGCHEEELHGEFEHQISRLKDLENATIAVVGCAEGYYAVGLKLRLPQAKVFAIDTDETTLELCKATAKRNCMNLIFGADVNEYMQADLIVMDVEGSEVLYLDPDRFPSLVGSHIIVELHNYPGCKPDVTQLLLDRFRGSHRVTMIVEGPRNPNMYKWLFALHSDYRWLAVSEGRPCLMSWFVMSPKGVYVA